MEEDDTVVHELVIARRMQPVLSRGRGRWWQAQWSRGSGCRHERVARVREEGCRGRERASLQVGKIMQWWCHEVVVVCIGK